jgi:hypothetical protein
MKTLNPNTQGAAAADGKAALIPMTNTECQTEAEPRRSANNTTQHAFASWTPTPPLMAASGNNPSVAMSQAARMLYGSSTGIGPLSRSSTQDGRSSAMPPSTHAHPTANKVNSRSNSLPDSFKCSAMHAGFMSIPEDANQRGSSVGQRKHNRHGDVI